MKKINILLGLLFLFSIDAISQVDLDKDEKFEFQNNYEFETGKNLDTKSILKLTTNSSRVRLNNFELSYEHKLSQSVSISAGLIGERFYTAIYEEGIPLVVGGDTIGSSIEQITGYKRVYRFQGYLEGRYYLDQSYLISKGFGDNVNGLYANVGIGSVLFNGLDNDDSNFFTYLGVGVQSRILKYGILDFNVRLNYNQERISLAPSVRAGFAISKNYKNLEFNNARCNILKCFEERNYQFKVPLNDLMYLSYRPDWNHGAVYLYPKLKFEHRLLRGFSFNHLLSYSDVWNINTRNEISIQRSGARFEYQNNLRWYFLKARNIANGKSADNLSGFYAETLLGISQNRSLRRDINNPEELILYGNLRELTYGINVGYQTRLFKRLYIDFRGYLKESRRSHIYLEPSVIDPISDFSWRGYGITLECGLLF